MVSLQYPNPRERLREQDIPLFEAMSVGSWYYTSDLERLWSVSSRGVRNALARLDRAGALVSRERPNHSRQGAPTRVYARADSFSVKTVNELRQKAQPEPEEEGDDDADSTDASRPES